MSAEDIYLKDINYRCLCHVTVSQRQQEALLSNDSTTGSSSV
jgi:hypothetical protein